MLIEPIVGFVTKIMTFDKANLLIIFLFSFLNFPKIQDIFECRTCGLTGSLCCCTECARVCHKGHDCKLKKTSPTAYCDCWEKCKCKALVSGHQATRYQLLNKLIQETDLVTLPNSRCVKLASTFTFSRIFKSSLIELKID